MSEETRGSAASLSLPDDANLEWLRKHAKRRLTELRKTTPDAQLADAQFALAKEYGFASWRALKAHIDSLTIDGQLFEAAKSGDVASLSAILDVHPERLRARNKPYEWTLLHAAAFAGHLAAVNLLLDRGADVNARERGDNTYAMHWAAAAGHADVVERLIDAGGDVIGRGDDHGLEIIGWASCWDGADDAPHHAVGDLLLTHGAHHTIFSAIAWNLGDEVRRIAAANPGALEQPMSHNENLQHPLHFAVRKNRPNMVSLLLELGADPLAKDGSGYITVIYATEPGVDRALYESLRASGKADFVGALALHDWPAAERLLRDGNAETGALHLMAKRNDVEAVRWLLAQGANPNALWAHWDSNLTPLHLAAWQGHADVTRALLAAGADPSIHDSKHDSDVMGWAEYTHQAHIVQILKEHVANS
ncbi:MAG: ankyrin repeat domain-containing protein [Gemmatimonadaceae bacterium]